MNYTSAEAAKLLRKLNEEQQTINEMEDKSAFFVASIDEKIEEVRPIYDYEETQKRLEELEVKIRKVKHIINSFNVTTVVPEFDMTIDQMLIYIPQLSEKKRKLARLANMLPKERMNASGYGQKSIIEYRYTNYDVQKAKEDYVKVSDELAKAQTALDVVNNSVKMEIDI